MARIEGTLESDYKLLRDAAQRFIDVFTDCGRYIARNLVGEAIELSTLKARTTPRRPHWVQTPTKPPLPLSDRFQGSLCAKIDSWVKNQRESSSSWPTARDVLRWYIMCLFWKTIDYRPSYRALALGHFLYSYTPSEIAQFTNIQGVTDTRVKSYIFKQTIDSFPQLQLCQETGNIIGRSPSDSEMEIIHNTFHELTLWIDLNKNLCSSISRRDRADMYISEFNSDLYREQRHFLTCQVCSHPERDGISWLVTAYNANQRAAARFLPASHTRIIIPSFIDQYPPL